VGGMQVLGGQRVLETKFRSAHVGLVKQLELL